ncbi:MAG TPA: spore maturation protein [Firmicutes bacterium]|nr:spore maturation protein [Bacillota bacterium]
MITLLVNVLSQWVIPILIIVVIAFALYRKISIFEVFVEGAKEGFGMAVRLIPFLVGMLVAIGLLRDSGAMDLLIKAMSPLLVKCNIPPEIIPLAIMRPISGSSALAITAEILQHDGPDSLLGRLASTMQGSTDTTLFVLTVYFGSVGIQKSRHALAAGLIGDLCGFIASVIICGAVFG